jgi:DNA/RNA endonuclease YhcR with UshA esterase domain
MRAFVLVPGIFLTVASAHAETISACDAAKYVDKLVTVEGTVSGVNHAASGKMIFVDMCGRYPNNALGVPILSDDAAKFPDIDSLGGKIIDVTGVIKLYQGRPEIILSDPAQLKVK